VHVRSKVDSRSFALGLVCLIGSGCAAGITNQPHGRAAGEWSVTLPTAASYSQGLAYGKGGSPLPDQWVDLDDLAQPMLAAAGPQKLASDEPKKKAARKHNIGEPQPASNVPERQQTPATPVTQPAARTELAMAETTQPAQADASMLGRYEARQSQSQEQQKFAGGDAIVIGASTLVIVLLVVLLLVLLL
jgi:hypothetical protein